MSDQRPGWEGDPLESIGNTLLLTAALVLLCWLGVELVRWLF